MSEREEKFEAMLRTIQERYDEICTKMDALKTQGKTKTATYRELLGNKLLYQEMLTMYRLYGLTEQN